MRYILRSPRRMVIVTVDLFIFAACYYGAFFLRFEHWHFRGYGGIFLTTLPMAVLVQFAGMYAAGVYRGIWRYASLRDLLNILKGTLWGTAGLILGIVFLRGLTGYPRSVFLIDAVLVVLAVGGTRFGWRVYREMLLRPKRKDLGRPVVIVGAGDAADDLIRELGHNPRMTLRPVAIVDDEKEKMAQEIHGVKVAGGIDELPQVVREAGAEEILIAIPSATGPQMRRIVDLCRQAGVPYRTVPGTGDILDGRVHVHHLRRVRMEDLLRRAPARLDRAAMEGYLAGKTVLVTGAGGSIGSELCRQIARFGPAELVLLDHSENSLFYLDEEFKRQRPGLRHGVVVEDVTDARCMAHLMATRRPDVVFHAAAHKHVPLMEENLWAALKNNVTGTRVVAEAAAAAGAGKFVFISTDKAVNPSSIMGVSKRLAEMVMQGMGEGEGSPGSEFVSVRFGNVLGSEGSVVPLFSRQIEAGGPVTVTHPEVVRYFMTMPEAVQLVLQAAAMGRGGEIFLLQMGEPIRIVELAREMISLSGLVPDVDVQIRFTGLRPGEKLSEELITEGEGIGPTPHEKIMVLRPGNGGVGQEVLKRIAELEKLVADCAGPREILALVRELVPEFNGGGRDPKGKTA